MILYVNGDSHTAAAEAVNVYAFAEDDPKYFYLGRSPHPDNLQVSWGKMLSLALSSAFYCDAESARSNDRIIRTTRQWIKNRKTKEELLVIIQWSTWEREEWYDEESKQYFQVNASGIDHVPQSWQEKYRHYVMSVDWEHKTQQAHDQIWAFHKELEDQDIPHIFFNGNNSFGGITEKKDWGTSYIEPYDPKGTFSAKLGLAGIDTVAPNSYHYGKDGHSFFNRFMLQYIIVNKFI